jgi:hypothetical protein
MKTKPSQRATSQGWKPRIPLSSSHGIQSHLDEETFYQKVWSVIMSNSEFWWSAGPGGGTQAQRMGRKEIQAALPPLPHLDSAASSQPGCNSGVGGGICNGTGGEMEKGTGPIFSTFLS